MQMLELYDILIAWFRQFTPNVWVYGDEYDEDPITGGKKLKPMPLISFGYPTGEFATNTMMTFNIWDSSVNWINVLSIENRITKALPSRSGVTFDIIGGTTLKYLDPGTGQWIPFTMEELPGIAQRIRKEYKQDVQTKSFPGESRGGIWLQRGTPFTQSIADPDNLIKRRTGNIIVRNFMIY